MRELFTTLLVTLMEPHKDPLQAPVRNINGPLILEAALPHQHSAMVDSRYVHTFSRSFLYGVLG